MIQKIKGIKPQGKPWTHKELTLFVLCLGKPRGFKPFFALLGSEMRKITFSFLSRSTSAIKLLFSSVCDMIAPYRRDFATIHSLSEEKIASLSRAPAVFNMEWICPLFHYKHNTVRAIIWELKYKENTSPLSHISALLYEEIMTYISDATLFDCDAEFLLIPIPISSGRRAERGYNQSEYICRSIVEKDLSRTMLYAPQWLQKIKETPKQSRSESREQRTKNLVGCFKADPRVEDKYVILIDDVVTTGSTLSEARKTLLETGAKDVVAFTIAH